MNRHTHYEVLGLNQDASSDEIKKRYRELALRFHPDVAKTGNATRFKVITEAYQVLTDSAARAAYDATLQTANASARPAGSAAANGAGTSTSSSPPPGAASTSSAPPQGDIIAGKYRLVREIARSNDVVYEAIDTAMGRRVAVKEVVIPPNLTGTARRERIERFNREARAAGKLSHPNIVTVYNFGEDHGRYYIAMEYLEGGTLRDALQTRGALPVQEAVDIASQVLLALSHAHTNRVVHRDVKPDNIHILPGGQIKLTDFGIARLTEEASLTGEGQVFGTPSYMSPEQIRGGAIDHRTDVFSLGIVLYEMLAGRKPFTGDSVVSITYAIMENAPPPLPGLSFGLEQVVMRALSKSPPQRYANTDEMRQALQECDKAPSLFFTPAAGQTGMGIGTPYAAGAPPGATYAPAGGPAGAMYVPPPYPSASVPAGGAGTTYAPPSGASSAPTPAPGPFVNWGQPGRPASPPPPFPRRPARPLLGQGTRTFVSVLLWSIILSGAVVGMVLLFLRAYEQQRVQSAAMAVARVFNEGRRMYETGDLMGAAQRFEQAARVGAGTKVGNDARLSLAITYNRIGLEFFNRSDNRNAEAFFNKAYDIDPDNADVHYNLYRLYDRVGDHDRALQEWQQSRNGRAGSADPAAPSADTMLQSRYQKASDLYNQAMTASNQGDTEGARRLMERVVGEAPGTDVAQKAQEFLNKTTSEPNFSP